MLPFNTFAFSTSLSLFSLVRVDIFFLLFPMSSQFIFYLELCFLSFANIDNSKMYESQGVGRIPLGYSGGETWMAKHLNTQIFSNLNV